MVAAVKLRIICRSELKERMDETMRKTSYMSYRGNMRGSIDNKVFANLRDADAVLDRLNMSIKNNGYATVSEYYSMTNGEVVDGDSSYGWFSLLNCQLTRTRYGYELRMPYPEQVVDTTDYASEAYSALVNDEDIEAAIGYLGQLLDK